MVAEVWTLVGRNSANSPASLSGFSYWSTKYRHHCRLRLHPRVTERLQRVHSLSRPKTNADDSFFKSIFSITHLQRTDTSLHLLLYIYVSPPSDYIRTVAVRNVQNSVIIADDAL